MRLHTCSEVISFARQMESEAANFYRDLAQQYGRDEEIFLSLAKENSKYILQIERAYYGVISDAIEGCFAFDSDPDKYTFETKLPEKATFSTVLSQAIFIEEKMIKFYGDAAEQQHEASSAEKLYLKVEKDRFYALFGDMDTDLGENELSRYSRRMTGLKSEADIGDFRLKGFAAETQPCERISGRRPEADVKQHHGQRGDRAVPHGARQLPRRVRDHAANRAPHLVPGRQFAREDVVEIVESDAAPEPVRREREDRLVRKYGAEQA